MFHPFPRDLSSLWPNLVGQQELRLSCFNKLACNIKSQVRARALFSAWPSVEIPLRQDPETPGTRAYPNKAVTGPNCDKSRLSSLETFESNTLPGTRSRQGLWTPGLDVTSKGGSDCCRSPSASLHELGSFSWRTLLAKSWSCCENARALESVSIAKLWHSLVFRTLSSRTIALCRFASEGSRCEGTLQLCAGGDHWHFANRRQTRTERGLLPSRFALIRDPSPFCAF